LHLAAPSLASHARRESAKWWWSILHEVQFGLTLRLLMSYIYGSPILDVSRSHTTTQHSR
jgi:hypothetical protein